MKRYRFPVIALFCIIFSAISPVFAAVDWSSTINGSYNITTFTYTGSGQNVFNWTVPAGVTALDYLLVGGGGGGAVQGGGGAGAFLNETGIPVNGTIDITVGIGGTGGRYLSANAVNGTSSIFGSKVAIGGGRGGNTNLKTGADGGSGGGSFMSTSAPGSGTTGQGSQGGYGSASGNAGGGGGGALNAGNNANTKNGGNGGNGTYSGITGIMTPYAGGGGGASLNDDGKPGTGFEGGGSACAGNGCTGTAGTDGKGGGGGGATYPSTEGYGGRGGHGILIMKFLNVDTTPPASITGLTNTSISCNATNWSWTNPSDSDYYQLITYKNGALFENLTNATTSREWTGLSEGTSYTLSTHTIDLSGNMNASWVNATVQTQVCGGAAAGGIPGTARFDSNGTGGVCPVAIMFYDESIGNVTEWKWTFGDGNSATSQNPVYIYNFSGLFNVTLWINTTGGNASFTKPWLVAISEAVPAGKSGPVIMPQSPDTPWEVILKGIGEFFGAKL